LQTSDIAILNFSQSQFQSQCVAYHLLVLSRSNLLARLLTATLVLPVVIWFVYWGRLAFLILVSLILTLAVSEYHRLVVQIGLRPFLPFGVALVWLSVLDAYFVEADFWRLGEALVMLASLTWQLLSRRERDIADWALTVAGGVYIGLCGAYLIRLRNLPADGLWWTLIVLSATFSADTGAQIVGLTLGRHRMTPELSAGKTWEGYAGGLILGSAGAALIAALSRHWGDATVLVSHSWVVGLLIAALAPMGDLAVSMLKRQAGVKDSGRLFPGHGGALDRLDSLLWAAVIGYYYVVWFAA
jgi:phosphatidate cytidylyltransferase